MQWRTALIVTRDLPQCWVRSTCNSSHSSVSLTALKAVFVIKSGSIDLKYHLDPAAWVPPGKINATKNCADCNWGLNTMLGEANVRFIALLSLFYHMRGRVLVGKAGRLTWKMVHNWTFWAREHMKFISELRLSLDNLDDTSWCYAHLFPALFRPINRQNAAKRTFLRPKKMANIKPFEHEFR